MIKYENSKMAREEKRGRMGVREGQLSSTISSSVMIIIHAAPRGPKIDRLASF